MISCCIHRVRPLVAEYGMEDNGRASKQESRVLVSRTTSRAQLVDSL